MKKALLIATVVVSFVVFFRLAIPIGSLFFTQPYKESGREFPVLLVCRDHVEARWFHHVFEVSPLPATTGCSFAIPAARQAWVEQAVRAMPLYGTGKAAYTINVKQLGGAGQEVQLELLGDGVYGLRYRAQGDRIVPLASRMTGPGGIVFPLGVDVVLWGGFWGLVLVGWRVYRRRKATAEILAAPE